MKKSVAIELDKVRNLRLGVNARIQATELLGKDLSFMQNGATENDMRVMLYCALVWEDSSLTLESVGELMDEYILSDEDKGYSYLANKIAEAVQLSMPSKKK